MGARRGFRVVLHTERAQFVVAQALNRVVVQANVGHLRAAQVDPAVTEALEQLAIKATARRK